MKLQTKITSSVILICVILNIIFQYSYISSIKTTLYDKLNKKIETNSYLLSNINSVALYNFQRPILEENLKAYVEDDDIQSISLSEINGDINIMFEDESKSKDNLIYKKTEIEYNGDIIGEIVTIYTKEPIINQINDLKKSAFLWVLFITLTLTLVLFTLLRYFIKPIIELTDITREISDGNLDKKIIIHSSDEIGILSRSFMKMSDSIRETIKKLNIEIEERKHAEIELEDVNKELTKHKKDLEIIVKKRTYELEESIKSLKATQNKLVESEKMSSLGNLVAGVAHEINTPIGIGVTAASHLDDQTKIILDSNIHETLSKSKFNQYLVYAEETSRMILSNLKKAADIIHGFKQIAVDQSSEERREFYIYNYIDEILHSTNSKFKHTNHTIEVDKDDDFIMNTYPGAISQIFTNLLMNSLFHGFENIDAGKIKISTKKENNKAIISYSDNGRGIHKDIIEKIYDPFFTTKRGQGGSGLGLNIVYNLVTQKLKGSIKCISEPEKGATFILELPINLNHSN